MPELADVAGGAAQRPSPGDDPAAHAVVRRHPHQIRDVPGDPADVLVRDGVIAEVGSLQAASGVEALDGYQGYLLGDVLDVPETSLSVLVMDEASQSARSNRSSMPC